MSSDIGSEDSVAKVESWLTKPVLPSRLFECLDNLLLNNEVDQAVARVTAPVENLQEEWRRQVRVLVVEDNLTNQTLVREQLSLLGYTVHVVDDAQHALEALAHDRYDVVLMDCELPGMDGYAATAEIRRREGDKHHTVVVALTAHATEGQRERCLEAGMNGYLSKPVKLQILGETIDGWTRRDGKSDESGPTESHGQPELEELDPATLADLAQLSAATGHNMFRNLVDDFLWDLSGRVVSIKDALDTNDLPRLATQVHPLKSASAIIGAKHFAIVCSDVEENARAGKADRAVPLARELLAAAQRLPAVLKRVAAQS